MPTFDRKKVFDGFRRDFDPTIEQEQVDGLEFLLTRFEQDKRWNHIPHIAYALGTTYHETAFTFQPITERGPKSYFNRYDIEHNPKKAKELGNTEKGDGYRFRGRGYVQLTGRKNYTRYGIADRPEDALNPDKAFEIMTDGMFRGIYTGKKLTDYISDTGKDYVNARYVINGQDKAGVIAGYAREFEQILRDAKLNSAAGSIEKPALVASDTSTSSAGNPTDSEPAAIVPTANDFTEGERPPSPIVPVPTAAIPVATVSAETESKIDKTISVWSARFVAIPAALFSAVAYGWAWVTAAPANVIIAIAVVFGAIAISYVLSKQIAIVLKDSRDARMQREREDRAHQVQMALMENAGNKDRNTLTLIKPPPGVEIPNSDNPANEGAESA